MQPKSMVLDFKSDISPLLTAFFDENTGLDVNIQALTAISKVSIDFCAIKIVKILFQKRLFLNG